ncbi:MAG: malectin domain-containing carbohydrate-binding protein, partial [Pseudomonadota bacterium]
MVGEQVYTLVHSEDHGCVCAGCNAHGHEATGKTDSDAERLNATVDAEDLTPDAIRANDVHRLDDVASSDLDEPQEQTARSIFTPGYDTNTNDADQPVDGLISGRAWDRTNLTFSFPDQTSDYGNNYVDSNAASSVQEFSNKQKNAARAALDDFASVSGLNFTELTGNQEGNADLRAAMSDAPGTAYAYYPSSNAVGGDSFYNKSSFNNPVVGNYAYFTILHEYGHALGLKHGHETNGTGAIPFEWDSSEFSVMTYRSYVGKSTSYGLANETWGFAQSLMMLDIAAIQRMYGADFTEEAGDTVYSFSTTTGAMFIDGVEVSTPGANRIFRTIWDGNGEDTYDFSNYSTDLGIDLAPGGYVDLDVGGLFQRAALENGYRGNFEYARGHVFNAMQYEGDARSLIENANGGSGDDTFWGNAADNIFRGNGGDDTFYDSAGADTYYGGGGTDVVRFVGDVASYTIDFVGGFLEVVNDAVDRVAESIETLVFGGESFSFADFTSVILPPPPPPNAAPDARNDSLRGDEGTNISNVDLLSNDADPEQSTLTIVAIDGRDVSGGQSVTLDSGASVRLNGDGTVTYRQNGIFDALLDGQTGNDSFTYTIADPEGARDTATVSVRIDGEGQVANDPEPDEPEEEPDPQPGGFSLYLNAGGQGFTDDSGTAWVSDGSYATQSRATGEGTSIAGGSSADRVYESHRWDPDLAYNIALENGTYDLTFKFAETYFRSAGKRVFDVDVEGVSVIDNLDVYGETGSRGASYDVVVRGVEVRDGRLDIDFSSDKNNAYLAGLVITSDGETPPDPQPEGFSLYLNAGGQGFTDAGGATWVGDGAYAANGRATGESTSISGGSSADSVYNSHRWASDLAYDIDLENGTYDLTFKFAET